MPASAICSCPDLFLLSHCELYSDTNFLITISFETLPDLVTVRFTWFGVIGIKGKPSEQERVTIVAKDIPIAIAAFWDFEEPT